MAEDSVSEQIRDLLLATVALLAEDRDRRIGSDPAADKTEVVLASCGLNAGVIARVLGKQPDAVRKSLSRARGRLESRADPRRTDG
jgi:DNA-directed RNA polymerase specialized sigma24 family protein